MRTIILAGGFGSRISEETKTKPKPMVLVDDKPIIWHLMSIFSTQGYSDFIIAAGYLGNVISEYVSNLDTTWKIRVLDTGLNTLTGGRIRRCMHEYDDERFLVTYGDGLGNVNITRLINHHNSKRRIATVTCVRPPARFGVLERDNGLVTRFAEKQQSDSGWISGGFFVLERSVADLIPGDDSSFEIDIMPKLASGGQLAAFDHNGFWHPMDTLREKNLLERFSSETPPPWMMISP